MRGRLFILVVAALVSVTAASADPKTYWCAITPDAASSPPGVISLHVTGTVPMKADPYLRIDGAQEWTVLHNQHGIIDDWTGRTTAELPPGPHSADLLDMPKGGLANRPATVIASCQFTVT